jgi:hypothetical protein
VSSYMLRILTSPSIALDAHSMHHATDRHGKGNNDHDAIDLQFAMRAKKKQAKTVAFRTQCWNETLYLLAEHLAAHAHSIGFPEVFWAVRSTLGKLRRDVKLPQIHAKITTLLQKYEQTAQLITKRRAAVSFGPCDVVQVKQFEDALKVPHDPKQPAIPIVAYHQQLRTQRLAEYAAKQKQVKEQRQTLEQAVAGGGRRKGQKRPRPEDEEE